MHPNVHHAGDTASRYAVALPLLGSIAANPTTSPSWEHATREDQEKIRGSRTELSDPSGRIT